MPDLKDRWEAFLKAHPNPETLIEEEKLASFRYAWDNDPDAIEHDAAVWQWRYKIMQDVAIFELGGKPQ